MILWLRALQIALANDILIATAKHRHIVLHSVIHNGRLTQPSDLNRRNRLQTSIPDQQNYQTLNITHDNLPAPPSRRFTANGVKR